jgi:diguanylate cyclase (GGDEF)-like protein
MHAVVVDARWSVLEPVAQLFMERGDAVNAFVDSERALQSIVGDLSVDVLVTSLEVEPLTGLELCWQSRLIAGKSRPLYVMVMSAQADQENVAQALDCGADDLIVVPISKQILNARLRLAARLHSTQLHLVRLAETDPLTGLFNRRAFFERLNMCLGDQQDEKPLSAIVFDIDFFKKVNDVHGHQAGDEVIAGVAAAAMRCGGIAGRLGGEEFCLILNGANDVEAFVVAEDLRARCAALSFRSKEGVFAITCSLGVAGRLPDEEVDALLSRADMALYNAKANGRNCTRMVGANDCVVGGTFPPIARRPSRTRVDRDD